MQKTSAIVDDTACQAQAKQSYDSYDMKINMQKRMDFHISEIFDLLFYSS
jgi:hypothetical protein